jgi:tetratricopeptide (TPR) repeat protein
VSKGNDLKQSMSDSLRQSASSYANLAQFDKAIDYYQQALAMTRQLGDRSSELEILREIGSVYVRAGDPDKAIEHLEIGLSTLRESSNHDPMQAANYLQTLSEAYDAAQNASSAATCLREVLKIFEAQHCDISDQIQVLLRLGDILLRSGDDLAASMPYQQVVTKAQQAQFTDMEAQGLYGLSVICINQGQQDNARRYLEAAAAAAQKCGNSALQRLVLKHLGAAYITVARVGDGTFALQKALKLLEKSEDTDQLAAINAQIDSAYPVISSTASLAEVEKQIDDARRSNRQDIIPTLLSEAAARYIDQGQYFKVVESYEAAIETSHAVGDRCGEMMWLTYLGNFYAGRYESYKAQQAYDAALVISREVGDALAEGQLLLNLGFTYADQERMPDAKRLIKEAYQLFEQTGEADLAAQAREFLDSMG